MTPYESAVEFLLGHVARHGDGIASVQAESQLSALPHVVAQREKDAAEAKKAAAEEAKKAAAEKAAADKVTTAPTTIPPTPLAPRV